MAYAIDLSERQTSRTVQQATRHGSRVELYPRNWEDNLRLVCHVAHEDQQRASSSKHLVLIAEAITASSVVFGTLKDTEKNAEPAIDPPPAVSLEGSDDLASQSEEIFKSIRGVYCDAELLLGDNHYLFCSDVISVEPYDGPEGTHRIILDRPESIQVVQRRRYWRFRPARSARVEMRWIDEYHHKGVGIGWLCNVSPEGLACRTDAQFSNRIYIGSEVTTTFKLDPTSSDEFTVDCEVCSKIPAGTNGKFVIGMQFLKDDQGVPQDASERIRQHLFELGGAKRHASKGADA